MPSNHDIAGETDLDKPRNPHQTFCFTFLFRYSSATQLSSMIPHLRTPCNPRLETSTCVTIAQCLALARTGKKASCVPPRERKQGRFSKHAIFGGYNNLGLPGSGYIVHLTTIHSIGVVWYNGLFCVGRPPDLTTVALRSGATPPQHPVRLCESQHTIDRYERKTRRRDQGRESCRH
jgi:hypothetical protein